MTDRCGERKERKSDREREKLRGRCEERKRERDEEVDVESERGREREGDTSKVYGSYISPFEVKSDKSVLSHPKTRSEATE